MKQEQLLDAIGGIDESFLMEAEKGVYRGGKAIRRVFLAAAIIGALALTAAAVSGLFGRPIEDSQIVTGETVAPFTMDAEGNILQEGAAGLKVSMEVTVNQDAPNTLEEFYVLELPEEWRIAGGGGAGDGYRYYTHGYEWKKGNLPGRIRLEQEVTSYYTDDIYGENCVGTLPKLTAEDGVTGEITEFAGIPVLKVTIPALPRYADDPSIDAYYCVDGETRLYWTDGNYMLMFAYPQWMSDGQAARLMLSLEKEAYVDATPEDYGKVNPESIEDRLPDFSVGSETGTTCANNTMGLGRFVYSDGYIYCAGVGCIYRYDLQTGQTTEMVLADRYAGPGDLFATDHYICYTDTWSALMALGKDGTTEVPVYEGVHSAQLYAAGSTLYTTDGIIDLNNGSITPWPEGTLSYYVDGNYIYILCEDVSGFLRAPKGTMDFETIPLSCRPISILADGEDIYLTEGGTGMRWSVIRYRNGEETVLPIRAVEFQVFDGHIIYRCEDEKGQAIKAYNMQTGESRVLHEDGFNFSILEERYVCIYCADSAGQGYCVILDWQTGEQTVIDTSK